MSPLMPCRKPAGQSRCRSLTDLSDTPQMTAGHPRLPQPWYMDGTYLVGAHTATKWHGGSRRVIGSTLANVVFEASARSTWITSTRSTSSISSRDSLDEVNDVAGSPDRQGARRAHVPRLLRNWRERSTLRVQRPMKLAELDPEVGWVDELIAVSVGRRADDR